MELQSAYDVIQDTWPNINTIDRLPESGNSGHEKMNGFMAPFCPAMYDKRYAEGSAISYTCGLNFVWHDPLVSPMPWVPLYKSRVMELVKDLAPGQFTHGLVLVANFSKGTNLSRGGCIRVGPDEWAHGVIFKIAERLQAGASDEERKGWTRSLLSCPGLVKRLGN